jgi:hypothetical protein
MWKVIGQLLEMWLKRRTTKPVPRPEPVPVPEPKPQDGRVFDGRPVPPGAILGDGTDVPEHKHPPAVVEIPRTVVGCREIRVRWNPETSRRRGKVIFGAELCGQIAGVAWFTPTGGDGEVMKLEHPHEMWSRERFYCEREMVLMPTGTILVRAETRTGPVFATILDCRKEQG